MTYEGWVERTIREATERGEFSGLKGAGRPLDLGPADDPDWWVKRYLEREGLDTHAALPPVMQLRAEAASYPQALLDVPDEESVREILRDYNLRMIQERRRPVVGRAMPVTAPRVDVEDMVRRWRALRAQSPGAGPTAPTTEQPESAPPRRWWRVARAARRLRRSG